MEMLELFLKIYSQFIVKKIFYERQSRTFD